MRILIVLFLSYGFIEIKDVPSTPEDKIVKGDQYKKDPPVLVHPLAMTESLVDLGRKIAKARNTSGVLRKLDMFRINYLPYSKWILERPHNYRRRVITSEENYINTPEFEQNEILPAYASYLGEKTFLNHFKMQERRRERQRFLLHERHLLYNSKTIFESIISP